MIKKVILCLFLLCLLSGSALAADQTFESHDYDILGYTANIMSLTASDHGYCLKHTTSDDNYNCDVVINAPFNGYIAFNEKCTYSSQSYVSSKYGLVLNDSTGDNYLNTLNLVTDTASGSLWHRIEFKENAGKTALEVYKDGGLVKTEVYSKTPVGRAGSFKIIIQGGGYSYSGSYYYTHPYIDSITNSLSASSVIDMDDLASVTDSGQYYILGVPNLGTGKYYQTRLYSPSNKVVYIQNFTSTSNRVEQLIPVVNISEVGEYTLHLYRVESSTSKVFLTMKTFEVVDPAATGSGTITLDKTDYQAGETVKVWAHLKEYADGYKIKCEFPTGGSNFKKEIDVTSDTFLGTFTIPDISNVIGSHTVYLLDPDNKVVDSAEFNCYVPGLPDIAFDKSEYDRSEKALIYYKDAKDDSELSITFRYGGTTAQTLSYNVEGTGTITLDLSLMPAADSMVAVIKDSDGYSNDDDNAKIIVGNFELSGRVYDAKTGAIIPGATVTVQGKSVNSDINGNYNLTALAGFANYSVVAEGYNSISGTVAVFDLKTIHNFYLSPVITNGGTGVYGTVVSSKTDYPLVGASVEITNTDSLKRYSTIVDSKGYYSVSHDDLAGNLSIRVSYNNYDSIVATAMVTSGSMQNHNFRLNAVPGYEEIDPSDHTGGQDSADPDETAEERAYREKYGEMGKHPFDFNGDGTVENSEWKYAFERLGLLIGCLAFMGFMVLISRRR